MPRPVPIEFDPSSLKALVVDYTRHKIVECLTIPNQPTYRRFVMECGLTIDEHIECCTGVRWDQSDTKPTCYGCGGT